MHFEGTMNPPQRKLPWSYELFILGLSVYVICALMVELIFDLPADIAQILGGVDNAICVVFLADFSHKLWTARSSAHYFVTWGWLDLLSSLPMIAALRWGRAARALRVIRVIRAARSSRDILAYVRSNRARSAFLGVLLVCIVTVSFGSIAIWQVERGVPGSNIHNGGDALWWVFVTLTTVGYGEFYPVTGAGRLVAAFVMVMGLGILSSFTGFIATWFVEEDAVADNIRMQDLQVEMTRLRQAIERLQPELAASEDHSGD